MSANSRIIRFGYYDHEIFEENGKKKHKASCYFCNANSPKLSEFFGTTSCFTRHLKRAHFAKWEEYVKGKSIDNDNSHRILKALLHPSDGATSPYARVPVKCKQITKRQRQISEEVVKFMVGCSLPLSIAEDKHFRSLLQVLDPRYQPMATSTLTSRILPEMRAEGNKELMDFLSHHSSLSGPVPDLSERMGMDGGGGPQHQSPSKMEASSSNFLTCSPIISAMPGIHDDYLVGAGPSSCSQGPLSEGDVAHVDYDQDDIDVKAEPVFNVSPEICEDENSQNNTQSSSDRPSSQSSPTPGMAGPYLLKKETHCTTILDQLLRDDTFSDVTLTAEGQSIRAHKIVLCLASAYFRQVLSKESTVQNVIVFRDIRFAELKNIINFIYTGEATVDAAELESFMKTAEMLEVNSLCDGQRSLPKNFLPRSKPDAEPTPEKSRTAASKRSQNYSGNSPPSKARRISDPAAASTPVSPKYPKGLSQPSTSTSAAAVPMAVIKSEPLSVDDGAMDDEFHAKVDIDEEDCGGGGGSSSSVGFVDTHAQAQQQSQYQDVDQCPPLERIVHATDNVVPGRCPFCPPTPHPQLRKGPALSKHVLTSHPNNMCFCCDACSRVFLGKGSFEAHKDDCNR